MQDPNNPDDELLDRAIASLREAPVPDGPAPIVQQRTVAALAAAGSRDRFRRTLAMAAMILVLIGFVSTIVQLRRAVRRDVADVPQNTNLTGTPTPNPLPRGIPSTRPEHHREAIPEAIHPPAVLASNVSITGHVFYRGPRPTRKPIDLSGCPQCAAAAGGPIYDESLVVNDDGSLQNVVVSISGGLPAGEQFASAADPVTLDQKGCTFRPHVIAARVGQPIVVKNSDPFLHTVHSLDAEASPAFNFAQPTIGERQVEPLRAVETFEVKCDLHPWMKAWVRVFNHPYFTVTRADGSFALPPLPPGTYRVKAWHETLGVREKQVVVARDHPLSLTFDFEPR
ncbi:MAG TPA: carboxypeptidase regulatory-like domain-containing protein [Tepidisphaeraceae bacterium]